MRLARTLLGAVVLLLLFGARGAAAQVGVTTDILTGTVADSAGRPLQGVTVEAVSLETGVQRAGQTDGRGRYRILFPDGGGRYQLFFRLIGMTPARRQAIRQGDDDRLVTDVRLNAQPVELDELVATGRRITPDFRPAPGNTETNQTPDRLARLPLDAGDLTAIASLAAGVVTTGGTDSTAAGFSVAGQRPSANATTLDGMTFGASSIPQDAVRSTRVVTNTFDVSRGQFSGGLVASTTRSGTRVFQMTVNGNLRDPALSVSPDSVTTQPQAQQQVSFGLGGPLITNKLFGFASGQVRHRGNDLITLLTLADGGAERYGIAEDSLARYQSALNTLGIPLTTGGVPGQPLGHRPERHHPPRPAPR
ncbi:MAG: carboxypeptidase regulatory-like domain-containing protein [Gemmatimonadetes bacterium]|nr:carboxypeptidase regulatory-like domain-containing protein [Gemmatimonadota bacterium]